MALAVADAVKRVVPQRRAAVHSVNRVFVERAVADEFIGRLTERAAKLIVATPGRSRARPRPATTREGHGPGGGHVADGGPGERTSAPAGSGQRAAIWIRGWFYRPTVVVGGADLRMANEETFGPAVPVIVVDDP